MDNNLENMKIKARVLCPYAFSEGEGKCPCEGIQYFKPYENGNVLRQHRECYWAYCPCSTIDCDTSNPRSVTIDYTECFNIHLIRNAMENWIKEINESEMYGGQEKGDVETYVGDEPVFNFKTSPRPTSAFYGASKKGLEELKKDIKKLRQGRE